MWFNKTFIQLTLSYRVFVHFSGGLQSPAKNKEFNF